MLHRLRMKVRLITSFGRGIFMERLILNCNCCTRKQYLDKVNDLNFAKSFFQKWWMKIFHVVPSSHAGVDEKPDINFHWPYYLSFWLVFLAFTSNKEAHHPFSIPTSPSPVWIGLIYLVSIPRARNYLSFVLIYFRDPSVLDELNLDDNTRATLLSNINRRLTPQAVKIRADVEVACYGYEGIDAVKRALTEGLKCSTEEIPIKVYNSTLFQPCQSSFYWQYSLSQEDW